MRRKIDRDPVVKIVASLESAIALSRTFADLALDGDAGKDGALGVLQAATLFAIDELKKLIDAG